MATDRLLAIYLKDHHAGATVGVQLARRATGSNSGSAYGDELAEIADEIAEDKRALEKVMAALDVNPDRVKVIGARAAEMAGRLKLNGSWLSYSPLSRVVELEGLVIGVTGKLALWEALSEAVPNPPDGIDFTELAGRARDQRSRLEDLRRRAFRQAFGVSER